MEIGEEHRSRTKEFRKNPYALNQEAYMIRYRREIGMILLVGGTLAFIWTAIVQPDLDPSAYIAALFASSVVMGMGVGMRFTWEIWELLQRFLGPRR